MIFGGFDLTDWFNVSFTRSISPSTTVAADTVPGKPGQLFRKASFDPIVFKIRLRWRASRHDNMPELRRMIAPILLANAPQPLILPDEPCLHYMAIMTSQSELSNLWYTGSAELEFTAFDPIAYGRKRTATLSPSAVFDAGGTYKASPKVTAKPGGSVSYMKLTNETTGEFVQVTASLTSSSTVVFDMTEPSVRINGVNTKPIFESDFFDINGATTLRLSSGTGTVEWTERWL